MFMKNTNTNYQRMPWNTDCCNTAYSSKMQKRKSYFLDKTVTIVGCVSRQKGQTKFLLNQSGPGPIKELATLFSPHNLAPHSDYQKNLPGPLEITVGDHKQKLWIMICCQTLLKRVLLAPVQGLKTGDLVLSLLTLAAREGSINFIHSDPTSNCNPLRTRAFFPHLEKILSPSTSW